MKKFFTLIAAALMSLGVSAEVTPITSWSFDDATSPELSANGTGTAADYTHAAVVGTVATGNQFLNAWRANATGGELKAIITTEDVTLAAKWILEFDFAGFSGCNKNVGQTIIADAEGNAILTITDAADWGSTFALSDGNTIACYACEKTNRGSVNTGNQLTATYWHHFTITGSASGIKMNVARYNANGTLGDNVITKSVLSTTNVIPSSISIKAGSWGSMGIDNLSLVTSDEADVVYNYTVKFVDNADYTNELKEASVRNDEEGASITLGAADKTDFYSEDGTIKYLYYGDDATDKTVAADGSTVVLVYFVKANEYDYTVNAKVGTETNLLESGKCFEGNSVIAGYPRYQLLDGYIYEAAVTNKEYRVNFTPENNIDYNVNYSITGKANVVYLSEGENIEGLTESTAGNLPVRGSNGKGGVTSDDVTITSLPAGKYVMVVGAFTSKTSQQNLNFTVGGTAYTASSSGNLSENTSPEFTLTGETNDVVFLGSTSSADAQLDYLYIQKTGEYNYFEIEANLPDTVTVTLGEVEDYAKLNLSDYISVKTNAEEYFPVINYAVAEEGVDKKDATYTPVLSEKPLYEVFTEPGTYYVFANVVAVFADESVDNISTDTIVVVLKEKETEPAEEPGVKYSYTLTSDITQLGTYEVTGGSIELLSGALETKNNLYGQKSGSTITAQVNMGRKLKANDCIRLTMFCSSNNKTTGLDITKDGTTSLVYFPLPSGNNKANTYTVEYIVKESDVNLIGVDTFSIKKITATDNLYLTGVEVEVLEKKVPVFTVQPVGKNVASYRYVNIPVKATGFPEPTYQWYVDGEPVDYDSEIGIFIGEPKTYTVYVTATNSEGSVNSEVIELKAIDDVKLNGNKCVISTDMEVADELNFFAEDCIVHLLDNGNFSVQAADAAEAPAGYSAIIGGTVNPTVNNDNVTGVGYEVFPYKTGVFTFVGKFNPNKAINIMKFTYAVNAKAAAGSLQADAETVSFKVGETEYNSGDSFSETYNGPITFDVDDEHIYIIYATSSKIGMYGFDFTETTAVDGVAEAQAETSAPVKFFKNGQLIIAKDGKQFNAAGAELK